LTKKELHLIELLLQVPEKTYTNEEIMFALWNDDFDTIPDIANLKNLISRLRKKLPNLNIENIYGFGYRLNIKS
jgi:DNA-binding response OmpR family regulator